MEEHPGGAQHLKKPHVPKSEKNTSLMKGLTPGQKRYLYSVMAVYETKGQLQALQRRYLHSLQMHRQLGHLTAEEEKQFACRIQSSQTRGGSSLKDKK
ncbi:protein FAM216B-like [Erpetoichthys calabaricus]|uniref:protein FAM216B-like n=1 Tax=Erpetoichthys calabaricus TaxID=27687 RepID=UPI00109FAC78|nr:protein FAM216B-like [Erpetoichthys calabaricus]XP_051788637.1 protein FAM216B-like [Erpetoichthys calabaricus]